MSSIHRMLGAAALVGVASAAASGALIQEGIYQLHNHPDGNADPPPYGLRLDGLDGSNDKFTISFDASGADVKMTYFGSTIRIFGTGYGGRDTGTAYANDAWLGFYDIDFTFDVGVGLAPGDDDLLVDAATDSNSGTIVTPNGTKDLYDVRAVPPGGTFRFGDADDDNGHRGFAGLSGWGWLEIDGEEKNATRDWLFTAEYLGIPAPGAVIGLAPAGLLAARRRRG
jgi:hypothetical protein